MKLFSEIAAEPKIISPSEKMKKRFFLQNLSKKHDF
jgi:hypothetical protein